MEINWNLQMHKFVAGTAKSMAVWAAIIVIIWMLISTI